MAGADGPGGRQSELEPVVSLVDVLEEDEELENEACAVLGGSDSEKCSYSQVGARRGPCLPRAPAESSLPRRTCPVPASRGCVRRGGLEPPFVVGSPIPGPAALLPSARVQDGPPPPSALLRPLRILQALALEQRLLSSSLSPFVARLVFAQPFPGLS